MTTVLRNVILPATVFPALGILAYHFIFNHLFESGLDKNIANACSAEIGGSSHLLQYTGFGHIDVQVICPLVAFFHTAMESPDAITFLTYFIGIGAPLGVIPAVEGWRIGRSWLIAYPVIFGLLGQVFTIGVTMPLYWFIFVLSGGADIGKSSEPGSARVTQAHAEAIIFGIVIGAIIPSVGMLLLEDPQVTAIWQPYPIYVSIAQLAHLAFRPASKHPESGYVTIRALYIGMFIISSSVHISTIWPLIKDLGVIQNTFLPSTVVPHHATSMADRVLHFLKWDLTFGFAASILATLWFARSTRELIALMGWNAFAIPVLGPGAALTGAALWRESHLQY